MHMKGTQTTIRLYGFVELDLALLPAMDKEDDINRILDRECSMVLDEMKEDFWTKYKAIQKR